MNTEVANSVSALAQKPGINRKTVKSIVRTDKTWTKKGTFTLVRKWIINFTDGYYADLVLLAAEEMPPCLNGDTVYFRVGYRSEKGDEIELVPEEHLAEKTQAEAIRSVNMNGHPAVVSIGMAKEIVVQNSAASGKEIQKESLTDWAEYIYKWLIEKK